MRKSFRGRPVYVETKQFRANERIFAREVMVIDEQGKNLGAMSKEQAISQARERELDLVEVSPKANPPICKFLDYGSFKYQQEKMERKQRARQKTTEVKTIKLSARISQHDLAVRIEQAAKFLNEGNKVKLELQLRGRENQHADLARDTLQKTIDSIGQKLNNKTLKLEQAITKQGGNLSAIIAIS
jgi:translation initiation factor IF-3